MTGALRLVKHRMPPTWDGARVVWDPWTLPTDIRICPPPQLPEHCEQCGSVAPRMIAAGLRDPEPGQMFDSTRTTTGRFGSTVHVPAQVPAWPLRDLHAVRCPDCLRTDVWDMRTDEWWTLGPEDYTDAGSVAPVEEHDRLF